jgi:hypothetical protein
MFDWLVGWLFACAGEGPPPKTVSPGGGLRPSSLTRQGSFAPPAASSSLNSSSAIAGGGGTALGGGGGSASAAAAAAGTAPKSKSKSRKEKAEASALRSSIAAKEFELHRLEKLIKKKGSLGAAQEISGGANTSATQAGQAMMTVLTSQQSELKDLKESYYKLTGVHYENSTRRRFLPGKLRSSTAAAEKPKNAPFAAAYAAAAATGRSRVPSDPGLRLAEVVAYPKIWVETL